MDAAALGLFRVVDLYRLFHLGRLSGNALFFRQLHLAVLLARNFRRLAAQLVWRQARVVAGVAGIFAGVVGALGARRFSAHLLLLPGRILQSVLG